MRTALVVGLACLALGCAADATGISLTVESDGTLDQIRVASPEPGRAATLLPEEPRALAASESVSVIVSGDRDGESVEVQVDGLREGVAVASGSGSVTIERGRFVELTVSLIGCDPGCGEGERCEGGVCVCDGASCAGCCNASNRCVAGDTTGECGSAGGACAVCEGTERCDAGSCAPCGDECLCGGEVCDPERTDRCERGACSCGGGPPCEIAEACRDAACVCGGLTCRLGASCEPANRLESCGTVGGNCTVCDAVRADACVEGQCRCGSGDPCVDGEECVGGECRCGGGPACVEGQRCNDSGECICDGSSCDGCCTTARLCETGDSDMFCGEGGNDCERCAGGERCRAFECD